MRKRLADRDPLTRKLFIFRWHLKHNGHIPEIAKEMRKKISEVKMKFLTE